MNTAVKFLILYLIPVITILVWMLIFMHGYGKYSEDTYANLGFILTVCAVVVSSILAFGLVSHFLTNQTHYLGIVFSIIPWVTSIIIMIGVFRIFRW